MKIRAALLIILCGLFLSQSSMSFFKTRYYAYPAYLLVIPTAHQAFLPGMQVIRKGEILRIIIPTDTFFQLHSLEPNPKRIATIKQMAAYVKRYSSRFRPPVIEVNGYTDEIFLGVNALMRSREYAEVIASYLWNAGVSPFHMQIQGLGSSNPIASNMYPEGSHFNRRVEVIVHF